MEVQKERERRYYEGIEEALQKYYATVIEELKQKVRDARAQNGYTGRLRFTVSILLPAIGIHRSCVSLRPVVALLF